MPPEHRPWTQAGPFTFRPDGCLTGVRWVPGRGEPPVPGVPWSLCVESATLPFVTGCLERTARTGATFDVFALLPDAHRWCGSYRVAAWRPPTLSLAPAVSATTIVEDDDDDPRRRPSVDVDVCARLRETWGVDTADDGIRFPFPDAAYAPLALLHGVLSDDLLAWCGGRAHRLDRTVVLTEWSADYPASTAFERARRFLDRYRYAAVLLYGPVDHRLQAILFHPVDGRTVRVHFVGPSLFAGEPGDVKNSKDECR